MGSYQDCIIDTDRCDWVLKSTYWYLRVRIGTEGYELVQAAPTMLRMGTKRCEWVLNGANGLLNGANGH